MYSAEQLKHIKHLIYEESLRYFDLPTLVYRGSRGDMIETYKIVNGKYDTAATPLQPCKQKSNKGHSIQLAKSYSTLNVRNNFFSLRIINVSCME